MKDQNKNIYAHNLINIADHWKEYCYEKYVQCIQKLELDKLNESVKLRMDLHLYNKLDIFPVRSIESEGLINKNKIPTPSLCHLYMNNIERLNY